MKKTPLLSILIPTRNREEFTVKVIRDILKIKDDRFQVVIQDNSNTNKLENLLSEYLNDSRIRYFYFSGILSFVENFSNGLSRCEGEYVTIIGDDDGINPMIIEITDWALKNNIDAITPSLQLIYYWPQSGVRAENDNGRLTISDITCRARLANSKNEVIKLLKNGCQNYLSYDLAKVYHGVIKRSVLDEIKNRTGSFIGGLSPDIYLSIATSILIKKVLIIDYPLTISGICNRSGSADSATGRHTGKLEQAPHFRGHNNYEWCEKVPAFYSVETIWGDSALAALNDLKLTYLLKYFNVDALSSYCMKHYPSFNDLIINNLTKYHGISKHSPLVKLFLFKGFITGPFITFLRKIRNRIIHRNFVAIFNNVPDIEKASEIIKIEIRNKNSLIMNRITQLK